MAKGTVTACTTATVSALLQSKSRKHAVAGLGIGVAALTKPAGLSMQLINSHGLHIAGKNNTVS